MQAEFSTLVAVGALMVVTFFTLTWVLSLKLNNFSFVDVTWSCSLAFLAPVYSLLGPGMSSRKMLAAAMGAAWSLRLGSYLLVRITRHHPREDARYQVLREKWKAHLTRNFFAFFQAQGLLILLLSVPVLLACLNTAPEWRMAEFIGAGVWLVGISGETLADSQMKAFKDSANRNKVCQVGLWRYSRHPNYFFEFIVWTGFWLFACGSPWGWVTIYAPALILYFLLRVTGIPLTEETSIQSKGEAYREYQRTTNAFVPWFRKDQGVNR